MKTTCLMIAASLALAACGETSDAPAKNAGALVPAGDVSAGDPSAGDKADQIGNREYETFGGVLAFGEPRQADVAELGHRVAFTFRATAGRQFEVTAAGAGGAPLDTVIALYGPKNLRTGAYPFIALNDDVGRSLSSRLRHTPRRDGIFLLLVTAFDAGTAEVNLRCRSAAGCESLCAIPRLYAPVCGADGETYSNPQAAACYDVPVVHAGACPRTCDDVACEAGSHCELQDVVCVRAPCPPVPVCVPDEPASPCDDVVCEAGSHCEVVEVQCIRAPCPPIAQCVPDVHPCALVRCAAGTHCVAQPDGTAACEPDVNPCAAVLCAVGTVCEVRPDGRPACVPVPAECRRTGCSGQICADRDVITTCEYRAEYACYPAATCERQADGACGFTPTPELEACLGGR